MVFEEFGEDVDPDKYVIPLGRALQGHPEAGALWEKMIVKILETVFGFKSTTHERNIYRGEVNGETIFICRQVDDFAIASDTTVAADYIISEIDKRVSTSNKGIGTKYNGVDILQTRDYIKLYCESYLDKVLLSHGWTEPGPNESMRHDMVPLSPDTVSHLQNLVGPPEHSKEHAEIEQKLKFSYRGLLGELLYSFIIIHVSIGNAIQLLSKFSSSPHLDHYMVLKNVCHYLWKHKTEGLIYWHTNPVHSLPHVPFKIKATETQLPPFPKYELDELVAFADATYATDSKTCRSVSRYIVVYAGAAIAYKAKMQPTVATSSMEAEFIAAVYTAKAVKHLHSVLCDLGLPQQKATIIYEDNKAAIDMINDSKPTT